MKVYLLKSGTMLIDRSQVLWNVDCGVRLRFPIYSVLVDHPEGLFLFDSGYDARARTEGVPSRGAASGREGDHPRTACALRCPPRGRDARRQLAPALRPRRR